MNPFMKLLFFISISLIFAIPPLQARAKTRFVTIGTGGLTGVYYPTGGAIAKIVNKKRKELGIRWTVESTDGSVYNVNAVVEGQFDFGIVQSDRQFQAVNGIADWKEKGPQNMLRSVFSIYPESCSLVATVNSGINSIFDLKGKNVNLGNHGSGHLGNAMDLLKSIGLDPEADLNAFYIDPVSAPGLLHDGALDAFFYTVGHPSRALKEATSGQRKVKFIPIDHPGMTDFFAAMPQYSEMVVPKRFYPGAKNRKDVKTFGVCATLVTSVMVEEEVVYAITKSLFENLNAFKELHPAYKTVTREGMLKCLTAPLHKGALKYFKETGLK